MAIESRFAGLAAPNSCDIVLKRSHFHDSVNFALNANVWRTRGTDGES
jgi:hypothetical protein